MEKKIIVLILVLLLIMPTILANDLEISLKPHFFKGGQEVLPTPEIQYSSISFEIIGKNFNQKYRILNLTIMDSYPPPFKKALPKNIIVDMLRIKQTKTLWISQIIDVNDFNQTNISLWIGVEGLHEGTREKIYSEGSINIILSNKTEEKSGLFFSIGNKIWENNPPGGLFVILVGIVIISFYYWKYKGAEKLDKWREKEEQNMTERKKFEEGW